ncbi:MAG: lytic transglycosylase domain-containing protein [Burkholderiales bacterium]|nr:MAG: lytic transglycosylase domain-containing protein [Burkholderiales bacterium]
MKHRRFAIPGFAIFAASLLPATTAVAKDASTYRAMVERHAAANSIPPEMVHRIIMRESRYNPRAVGRGGAMGMMQIKLATARGVGYTGDAQGLLDAETNLTYAVKYLAGAYRTANGHPDRTVSYYAGGYYYAAKRQRFAKRGDAMAQQQASALPGPLKLLPAIFDSPEPRKSRRR